MDRRHRSLRRTALANASYDSARSAAYEGRRPFGAIRFYRFPLADRALRQPSDQKPCGADDRGRDYDALAAAAIAAQAGQLRQTYRLRTRSANPSWRPNRKTGR